MKLRAIAAVAAIALALSIAAPSATFAQANGSIDIFYVDPLTGTVDFGACQGAAIFSPPFTALFFSEVHLRLNGASAGGISGIEGFIEARVGMTTGTINQMTAWNAVFTPVAGTVADGNFVNQRDTDADTVPDTKRGNFAFANVTGPNPEDGCQNGDGVLLKLGDLQMNQSPVVTPVPNDTWLRFVAGNPPSNASFPCPLVTLCDAPAFSSLCITGGSFLMNPTGESCSVGVEEETWSGIKKLYR